MWRNQWWFLLCLFMVGIQAQESPCPNLFRYEYQGNRWIGIITVPSRNFGSTIDIKLTSSLGAELPDKNRVGRIEVVGDEQTVARIVANRGIVTYRVHFPLESPIPKVTSIAINNEEYCKGEPETFSDTVRYITAISLEHHLTAESVLGIDLSLEGHNLQTESPYPRPNNINRYPTTTTEYFRPRPRPPVQPQVPPPNRQPNPPPAPPPPRPRPNPPTSSTAPPHRTRPTDPPRSVINELTSSNQSPNFNGDFEEPCGISPLKPNQLIYEGVDTEPGDWPWMAAIFSQNPNRLAFICSGTLVSRTEVITAAHCVFERNKIRNLVLKLGIYDIFNWTEPYTVIPSIQKISPHSEFDKNTLHNDIAVIKITRVEYSEFIKPACLWGSVDIRLNSIVKHVGTVVGWGKNEKDLISPTPKSTTARIVSTDTCRNDNKDLIRFTSDKTLCAGDKDGKGPCFGDSGGGLYLKRNDRWYLRGIVSNSLPNPVTNEDCGNIDYIVYTDAAQYTTWIENVK